MVYAPPRRKFSVDDYYRMADAGIFHEDDRVELLDGEIYEMTPIGDRHARTVNWLSSVFTRRLGDRVVVSPQNPVRLSDYSEPQPDVAVLRRREDFYRSGKPRPEDVFLIVEVAKSSLDYDRVTKLPRYPDAGILEVWIVNLADDQLEIYRKPGEGGYSERIVLVRGDSIAPEALPDLVLSVDEILG